MTRLSDKYRLGARIGGGGMAEVFEGVVVGAEGFARPVAIKRMLPALSQDPDFGEMFINEARLASYLHHPNIASVLDFDRDEDGSYFLVIELIKGVDLRRLSSSGALPYSVSAAIVADVLRGLAYAHDLEQDGRHLGLVHRDVSPHNVMVAWDGGAKLVDFGIAKAVAATGASRSGALKGKIGYMSPEQAHGVELDGRSDVFAVGVMFHEMLTAMRLFRGATEPEILSRLLTQPIPPPRQVRPGVPADLEVVALRMLERDRDQRYPSAHHALEALVGCPSMSARAQIELAETLRERFPDEAPRRRAESEPNFAVAGSPPSHRVTLPMAEGGDATATPGAIGMTVTGTATHTPGAGQTPTAAGQRPGVAVSAAGQRPSSRAALWVALALVVGFAAVIAVAALSGGGEPSEEAALAAGDDSLDAATELAPVPVQVADGGSAVAQPAVETAGSSGRDNHRPAGRRSGSRRSGRAASSGRGHEGAAAGAARAAPDAGVAPAFTPPDASVAAAEGPPDASLPPPPPPEPGKLRVVVDPWAEILIGGRSRGSAPKTLELPPGEYQVRLRNPELGDDETITVVIESGKTATIRRAWK